MGLGVLRFGCDECAESAWLLHELRWSGFQIIAQQFILRIEMKCYARGFWLQGFRIYVTHDGDDRVAAVRFLKFVAAGI